MKKVIEGLIVFGSLIATMSDNVAGEPTIVSALGAAVLFLFAIKNIIARRV